MGVTPAPYTARGVTGSAKDQSARSAVLLRRNSYEQNLLAPRLQLPVYEDD